MQNANNRLVQHEVVVEDAKYIFQRINHPVAHPMRIVLSAQALADYRENGFMNLAKAFSEYCSQSGHEPAEGEFDVVSEGDEVQLDIGDWIILTTGVYDPETAPRPEITVLCEEPRVEKHIPVWREAAYVTARHSTSIKHVIVQNAPVVEYWDARLATKNSPALISVDTIMSQKTCRRSNMKALGLIITGRFSPIELAELINLNYGENFAYREDGTSEWRLTGRVAIYFTPEADPFVSEENETTASNILVYSQHQMAMTGSVEDAEERLTNYLTRFILNEIMISEEKMQQAEQQAAIADQQAAAEQPNSETFPVAAPAITMVATSGITMVESAPITMVGAGENDEPNTVRVGRHGTDVSALLTSGVGSKDRHAGKKPKKQAPPPAPALKSVSAQSSLAENFLQQIEVPGQGMDGVDHINASESGVTELGRFLAINARTPFNYSNLGQINSIGGLWAYLATEPSERTSFTLQAYGTTARQKARSRFTDYQQPGFKIILADATMAKIISNPEMAERLATCDLPFQIYHIRDDASRTQISSLSPWYIPALNEIRETLRARLRDGQPLNPQNGEEVHRPDFSFLNDRGPNNSHRDAPRQRGGYHNRQR